MMQRFVLALSAFAALAGCRGSSADPPAPAAPAPIAASGSAAPTESASFAVVELFTSEGCSSCPPADAVFADIARSDTRVFAVAFHVDYWDDLGWPDRYATHAFTSRQYAYATAFGKSGVYTPQMVVNGTDQMNGADRARADTAIARGIDAKTGVTLQLSAAPVDRGIFVRWRAEGAPSDARIVIVLVDHEKTTNVRAGENKGRTLVHANVARAMTAASPTDDGARLDVAADVNRATAQIVAWVQRSSGSRAILAAARAPVP
jgi:hypothetical protein